MKNFLIWSHTPSQVLASAPSDNNLKLWRQLGTMTTNDNAEIVSSCKKNARKRFCALVVHGKTFCFLVKGDLWITIKRFSSVVHGAVLSVDPWITKIVLPILGDIIFLATKPHIFPQVIAALEIGSIEKNEAIEGQDQTQEQDRQNARLGKQNVLQNATTC